MTKRDDFADTKILIVDDEPAVREFVERALSYHGYQVVVASDGDSAIRAMQENGHFDLLLTDIVMPDMDGISLALKTAGDFPNTKIMMMSGYTQQRERAYNLEALVVDIIEKPFTIEGLCKSVDTALRA